MSLFNKDGTDFSDNYDTGFEFTAADEKTVPKFKKSLEIITHQYYYNPPTQLVLINDSVSKELFTKLNEDEFYYMINHPNHWYKMEEREPAHKKGGKGVTAETKFSLKYTGALKLVDVVPFSLFDLLVLSACMTEFKAGHRLVTSSIIYRTLGGTKDPGAELKQKIYDSLKKMTELHIRLDASDSQKKLFHIHGNAFKQVRIGKILPAVEVQATINGKLCTAFCITDISIVCEYAECKGHTASLKIENLSVPKTKQTYTTIMLRTYIYSRIARIMRPKAKAAKTIVIDTLMSDCNFEDSDNMFRYNLFKHLQTYMNYLVEMKLISRYTIEDKSGNSVNTINKCERIVFQLT